MTARLAGKSPLIQLVAVALLILFFIQIPSARAEETTAKWCEKQWLADSAEFADISTPDYEGLLKRWQQYAPKCSGTIVYEARLAIIYIFLQQTDKAREILKELSGKPSEFGYLVDLAFIQADEAEMLSKHPLDEKHLGQLEAEYSEYVKKYPNRIEGLGKFGGFLTSTDRHPEAIKLLERAAQVDSNLQTWSIYRNLTISYAAVERYADARHAAETAFSLRKEITSDRYFACALATADAGVGKFEAAQTILKVIAMRNPDAKKDPEFLKAARFVLSKSPENKTQP